LAGDSDRRRGTHHVRCQEPVQGGTRQGAGEAVCATGPVDDKSIRTSANPDRTPNSPMKNGAATLEGAERQAKLGSTELTEVRRQNCFLTGAALCKRGFSTGRYRDLTSPRRGSSRMMAYGSWRSKPSSQVTSSTSQTGSPLYAPVNLTMFILA